jgi:hypothetical protein
MTVIELAMKLKHFNKIEDAEHIMKHGGFKINSTNIANPAEALVFGQHILMNNISVVRSGEWSLNSIFI